MKNIIENKPPNKCQAKNPYTNEPICDREIGDRLENKCIFHCPKTNQAKGFADEFKKRFLEELKKVDESDLLEEFNGEGFIFPDKIKLNDIVFNKAVNFNHCDFGDRFSLNLSRFKGETVILN